MQQLQYTNHENKTIFNVNISRSQLDNFNPEQLGTYEQLIQFFKDFDPKTIKSEEEHRKASLNLLYLYKFELLNNIENKLVKIL